MKGPRKTTHQPLLHREWIIPLEGIRLAGGYELISIDEITQQEPEKDRGGLGR